MFLDNVRSRYITLDNVRTVAVLWQISSFRLQSATDTFEIRIRTSQDKIENSSMALSAIVMVQW